MKFKSLYGKHDIYLCKIDQDEYQCVEKPVSKITDN